MSLRERCLLQRVDLVMYFYGVGLLALVVTTGFFVLGFPAWMVVAMLFVHWCLFCCISVIAME